MSKRCKKSKRLSDSKLGMQREITRRDFIHDVGLASLLLNVPASAWASTNEVGSASAIYPPTSTGLRGAHPGSFEVAHALAREGKIFDQAKESDEHYDLIVVGGGISGLAAAFFYRKLHGSDSSILILDNHDDFGGHAKRNEFHQGGEMRLAWGGTVNMEYPHYSDTAMGLLNDLGIDIQRLLKEFDFRWTEGINGLKASTWFDQETFGKDVLLPGMALSEMTAQELAGRVDEFPLSEAARSSLRQFLLSSQDVLLGMKDKQKLVYLSSTSYRDFLREHFAMPDGAFQIFSATALGFWGVRAENLSVIEALESSLPCAHVLGNYWQSEELTAQNNPSAMFPDGNSSIARLLVRSMVPMAFPDMNSDSDPFSIVTTALDYSQLDQASSSVKVRLKATAVEVENKADGSGVAVNYVKDGEVIRVHARASVLACYNRIIPSLCPQMPDRQKEALSQCIKRPMLIMNVALRNGQALQNTGISSAYLPGRLCQLMFLITGINAGDYHPQWRPQDPCVIQFYGGVSPPQTEGLSIVQQNQAGRARLLAMDFEDFESEVRTVMSAVWGAGGFDAAEDILAITVNRWPHGYARDHLDLEDANWNADPPPNVVGRQPFGNITIANSDAGADAYTHTAIDQAWRAVNELPSGVVSVAD